MAVTLSLDDYRAALRISDTSSSSPIGLVLERISRTATVMVEAYAEDAPAPLQDEAAARLAGWLFDTDPSGRMFGGPSAMRSSGAGAILSPYRDRRAPVVEPAAEDTEEEATMARLEVTGGTPDAPACTGAWTPPRSARRVVLVVVSGVTGTFTVEASISDQWVPLQILPGNPVELPVYTGYRLCSTAAAGAEVLLEARN